MSKRARLAGKILSVLFVLVGAALLFGLYLLIELLRQPFGWVLLLGILPIGTLMAVFFLRISHRSVK